MPGNECTTHPISIEDYFANLEQITNTLAAEGIKYKPTLRAKIPGTGIMGGHWVYVGSSVLTGDGGRTVLHIDAYFVIYVKLSDGKLYQQERYCFMEEVKYGGLIEGFRRARGMATLSNCLMKAMIVGYGGAAAWVLIGGELITGTSPNLYEKDGPTLREIVSGIAALLTVRRILKEKAPTLYDKLYWGFIKDMVKDLPKVIDTETFFVFLGENIGYIVKNGLKGSLKFWKTLLVIAFKVITRTAKLLPKAASATARSYIESAQELVAMLVRMGVDISRADQERIIKEMREHGPEIIKALLELEKELRVVGDEGA